MERGTPYILEGDALRVAALDALKDDLLATLAHEELRTPLTAMKGARALENLPGEAPQREFLQLALQTTDRLSGSPFRWPSPPTSPSALGSGTGD